MHKTNHLFSLEQVRVCTRMLKYQLFIGKTLPVIASIVVVVIFIIIILL